MFSSVSGGVRCHGDNKVNIKIYKKYTNTQLSETKLTDTVSTFSVNRIIKLQDLPLSTPEKEKGAFGHMDTQSQESRHTFSTQQTVSLVH